MSAVVQQEPVPELSTGPDITLEEMQLAARNHSMPLEALRYPITPVGLHYLLTHFDIPRIDPAEWRLAIGGHVHHPLTLTLDDLRGRPAATRAVTLECAGNGRAKLSPRPISQPWLFEAVGNAEWTGTPLRPLLDAAGPFDDAVEVVFTGLDRGVQGGIEQRYERSLTVTEAFARTSFLPTRSTGNRSRPNTGSPCGSWYRAGTARPTSNGFVPSPW